MTDSTHSARPGDPHGGAGENLGTPPLRESLPVSPEFADPSTSARWHLPSHLRLWLVAIAGVALDLGTKSWAFTSLDPDPNAANGIVIPNVMAFRRSLNSGALFGLGKGWTPLFIFASVLALGFVLFLFIHSTRNRRSLHVALGLVLAGALGNLYDRAFVIADVVKFTAADGRQHTIAGTIIDQDERGIRILEGQVDAEGPDADLEHARLIPPYVQPVVRQQGVVRDFIKMEPRLGRFQVWPWVFNLADAFLVFGVGLLMINFWWDRQAEKAQAALMPASEPAA